MTRLPSLRPREVIGALQKSEFTIVRIRGSHYQLHDLSSGRRVTVPHHTHDLSKATLASILKQAQISVEAFLQLL